MKSNILLHRNVRVYIREREPDNDAVRFIILFEWQGEIAPSQKGRTHSLAVTHNRLPPAQSVLWVGVPLRLSPCVFSLSTRIATLVFKPLQTASDCVCANCACCLLCRD